MAGRRKAWSQLSPAYRRRLERQGITAESHRRETADLRAARGHRPPPGKGAAPEEATTRASVGLLRTEDAAALERWRDRSASKGGPPAWLPKNREAMGSDTAAILSQIRFHPSNWKHVNFTKQPDGRFRMTVTPKRGYPQSVTLPDRDAMIEASRFIAHPADSGRSRQEQRRLENEWKNAHPDVTVTGS